MKNTIPSCLYSGNAWFVEDLYEAYLNHPESIEPEWRTYFDSLQSGESGKRCCPQSHSASLRNSAAQRPRHSTMVIQSPAADTVSHQKQTAVLQLINAHRFNGHRQSDLDPLKQYQRPDIPELDPAFHGLTEEDMDKTFNTGSLFAADEITLREIIHIIKTTYCGSIGAEYMHINETEQKRWIQKRLEEPLATPNFDKEQRIRILDRVIDANALEEYLHTKYVGQKRFSLEGGESLIPLLDESFIRWWHNI